MHSRQCRVHCLVSAAMQTLQLPQLCIWYTTCYVLTQYIVAGYQL